MVNGIELCENLEEHFFNLTLSDAIFELKMKGFIAVYDWSLKKRLWKFKQGFTAVFNFDSFVFLLIFWGWKDDVFLIFGNLSHYIRLFPARFFHFFCNLFKGITLWLGLNKFCSLGKQLMCLKFTFKCIWGFGFACWIALGINWSVSFRIRVLKVSFGRLKLGVPFENK